MYRIVFAEGAEDDVAGLRPFDRSAVLDAIEEQLKHRPTVRTKHRKVLEKLVPPWRSVAPVWQLSVGEFRVFYDVDEVEKEVAIRAVRRKPPHATTEEIL